MRDQETLRELIAPVLRRHGVPGGSIAARHGDELLSLRFGSADASGTRSVDDDTIFHLFSGTKLFTAAALMLLRERGAIDLDAPVTDHLPDLALRHPVTIRQLASHSSGLPDTLRAFLAVHLFGEQSVSTAAALARYRTSKGRAPGSKAAYRNVNYAILGELVSTVSGMPYTSFVEAELLRPLGSAAKFDYTPATRANAAVGTIHRFSPMRWLLRLISPADAKRLERSREGSTVSLEDFSLDTAAIGGLIGRSEDFLPLATELLSPDDGLLRAESKREMLTLQARGRAGIASAEGVGIGWKCGRQGDVELWNHEGGGAGFMSETRIYPADGLGIVLMVNATQTRRLSWMAHAVCEVLRAT